MTPKWISTLKNMVITGLMAVFFIVVGVMIASKMEWTGDTVAEPVQTVQAEEAQIAPISNPMAWVQNGESPFVAVAEKIKPQVVNITSEREVERYYNSPFDMFPDPFWQFFGPRERDQKPQQRKYKIPSGGSGIIIDREGYILTNNHVVEDATKITVKLEDDREVSAEIIGNDPETDLALIKIDADIEPRQVAVLGTSSDVKIGEWAIAIGNPFGLGWTLTVGVVSALGRSNLMISGGGPSYQDFIQTDASINFGNSGGPLVNIKGEVIGINSAVNTEGQGIGFAIPVDIAKQIVRQLREHGVVTRGYLGMVPAKLTPVKKEALDMDPDIKGVFVDDVQKDTPAEKGGLKAGDVILEFNGEPMDDVDHFRFKVAENPPDSDVTMLVWRDGKSKTLRFTLGNRSEFIAQASQGTIEDEEEPWLGIYVESVNSTRAREWGIEAESGVLIVDISNDSPALDALQVRDVIIQIGKQEIEDMDDYRNVVGKLENRSDAILFRIKRGERTHFEAVDPELGVKE